MILGLNFILACVACAAILVMVVFGFVYWGCHHDEPGHPWLECAEPEHQGHWPPKDR